jgi:hypothetical protein
MLSSVDCITTTSESEFLLEPISKSFEEDDQAGKLDKAEEIVGVVFPSWRPEIGWYLDGRADHLGRDASHLGGPPRGINVS